jgi:hypothetical protein
MTTGSPVPTPGPSPVRARSWAEIRWRQFRNAPRPVFRAVVSDLAVAGVLGLIYLAYDVALSRGAHLPGGDLRVAAGTVLVAVVVCVGSVVTFLVVPAPGFGQAARPGRRSLWSAALGFFAAVPIAYLTLVVAIQVLKPILV